MQTEEVSHTFTQEAGDVSRLNHWLFDTIQPYIKGRTIEMGSGHGAISSLFVAHDLPIHLSDELEENRLYLDKRFQEVPAIRMIHDMDFLREDFEQAYNSSIGAFSTAVAINISEHGYYNEKALNNAKSLLRIRVHFMLIAPVHTTLYNGLEEDLDEWKKHNAMNVKKSMGDNIDVLKVRYFNWQAQPGPHSNALGLSTIAIFRKVNH